MAVALLLVATSALILFGFEAAVQRLDQRVAAFGLNTIVVRETVLPGQENFAAPDCRGDPCGKLREHGTYVRFVQSLATAKSDLTDSTPVFGYTDDSIAYVARTFGITDQCLLCSDTLPVGVPIRLSIDGIPLVGTACQMPLRLRAVLGENGVLVPAAWLEPGQKNGYHLISLLEKGSGYPSIEMLMAVLEQLFPRAQSDNVQIQSAAHYVRELESFRRKQKEWRNVLVILLGGIIALVFGAIALLEFNQQEYIAALLRSFGVHPAFVVMRYWFENSCLANVAGGLGLFIALVVGQWVYQSLGLPAENSSMLSMLRSQKEQILIVALCVYLGAWVSVAPVFVGARREIGKVLS